MIILVCLADTARANGIARWRTGPPPPLHPTIIEGTYKEKTFPIIAVAGEDPEVMVEGKLRRLSSGSKARYTPQRGSVYAPGNVALRGMNANSSKTNLVLMFSDGGEVSGGTLSARSDFSATVIPSQDYNDCYIALIFFDQEYIEGGTDNPGASVQFAAIKPLRGGKENQIKLSFGYMDFGQRRTGFFPLFFTRGLEIRSDQCELVAHFFRHREMTIHEQLVRSYRQKNPDKTVALQPYLQIPPLLPEDIDPATLAKPVETTFMVNEEGIVESLQFESKPPPELAKLLIRTLNGWLFFPRLKEGRPVRTMVRVPIVLQKNNGPAATPASGT